jgi:hypothetical protein
MAVSVIRNFIAKQLFKQKGAISNNKSVEFSANALENRLKNLGIDPNAIRSEKELNQILAYVKQAEDQAFNQRFGDMLGGSKFDRKGEVFDMSGKKLDSSRGIMGGTQINEQTLKEGLMKTDNPFSDLVKTTEQGPKTLKQREAEVLARMEKDNKAAVQRIRDRKRLEDRALEDFVDDAGGVNPDDPRGIDDFIPDPEDMAQGGRAGFSDGTPDKKSLLDMIDVQASGTKSGKQQIQGAPEGITADRESINAIVKADIPISQKIDLLARYQYGKGRTKIERDGQEIFLDEGGSKSRDIGFGFNKDGEGIGGTLVYNMETGEPEFNFGFRKQFKDGSGMSRRSFLKILGGLAAIPIVGKFLKPIKTAKGIKSVPIIKTDNVAGKPEWFDALVNKVIIEGDDVTKKFATADRQAVHQKTLDDGSVVRVTEDVDDGAVRVEYESEQNVFGDPVQLEYKKPLPDEGAPSPTAEFTTAESGPVGRRVGPDDYDIDVDEVGGSSISDLDSDVSKLKEFATGKKPTMKEIFQNKRRRDKAAAITDDPAARSDAVVRRQGEMDSSDYETLGTGDDFASGGIARMLGE